MARRALIITLLLMLLLNGPLCKSGIEKDLWFELEKGLQLCGVENIIYQSSCFIKESGRERILSSAVTLPSECEWSMQGGYESEEVLLQVRGHDRQACSKLWGRLEAVTGSRAVSSTRTWSVEAFIDGDSDLTALGMQLIKALGGSLQSANINSRTVQLLAYLPWVSQKMNLEEGPVNLILELYEDAFTKQGRIRLGIPVLLSTSF